MSTSRCRYHYLPGLDGENKTGTASFGNPWPSETRCWLTPALLTVFLEMEDAPRRVADDEVTVDRADLGIELEILAGGVEDVYVAVAAGGERQRCY